MKTIGFDLGSAYTKAVLLDDDGGLVLSYDGRRSSDDRQAVTEFLERVDVHFPQGVFACGMSGGRDGGDAADDLVETNGIMTVVAGIGWMGLKPRRIIEIGGHSAKSILLNPDSPDAIREFTIHDACAAGSGSFFESQAERLGMTVEELAARSAVAKREAVIAGRCAVFAKSDMIHLQQKGTPVDEIALGVCMAICRNALATLLKSRDPEPPVVIAGGCAKNGGIIRAFRTIFRLPGNDLLTPSPYPGLECAIGAAVKAASAGATLHSIRELKELVGRRVTTSGLSHDALPPLRRPSRLERRPEPEEPVSGHVEGFIGVDLGSVSTDFVVTDAAGELLTSLYLPTRGAPLDVLREGLSLLKKRFPNELRVLGCGTTGSGRHLAAKLLGADIVTNEITCQLLGACRYMPDVDSIIEIGGQDSKFISVRGGRIGDFAMNKVCAAGTGSFLEEQAVRMGISIVGEFAEHAFAAASPKDLGSRCTVFMETEVVGAMSGGATIDDICAGLACSIARNYLAKVVGNRPLGDHILLQGGTASNDAVVAAFEHVLGRPVAVHPYNRISGAIGAADAARSFIGAGARTAFRGLEPGARPKLNTFRCGGCPNNCEVNLLERDGEQIYFGDTCERYTSQSGSGAQTALLPNLASEYVSACEAFFEPAGRKGGVGPVVGIPRASVMMASLPFWGTFFREIGCVPVLSGCSNAETLAGGLKRLPVGVCLPIKLAAGHVDALLAQDVDVVFLPSIICLPGERQEQSHTCPYSMAVPFMISAAKGGKLLSPALALTDEASFVEGMASCCDALRTSVGRMREAFRTASTTQLSFDAGLVERGRRLIADGGFRHLFVVLGKPYNTFDAFLNLSLFERLRRMGVLAMPPQYLDLDITGIETDLPWRFSADILRCASAAVSVPSVYPVIISNFGCGPDAFTFKQLEPRLAEKPHLSLEFDEHRGEAGLVTRLEAFLDQVSQEKMQAHPKVRPVASDRPERKEGIIPEPGADVRIPNFGDIVYAFSGMWKRKGYNVEILPDPDRETLALGERHSLGKECLPYSIIAGELLRLHQVSNGRKLAFYVPGLSFPCLLQQYGPGLRQLMADRGIDNIMLTSPNATELTALFGVDAGEAFYMGLLAIELLVKATCEIRPYELEKGMTQALHRENLRRIEEAVAGGNVADALDESLRKLADIRVDRSKRRPLIGISGDIYAKSSRQMGGNLFLWLERQGLEVWPSPFNIDFLDFSITRWFLRSVSRLELSEMIAAGSIALKRTIDVWRMKYTVGNRISRFDEPGYLELKHLASPYITNEEDELLFVNIAKIIDFHHRGVDGIINTACFNCMVGNASTAIIEKIRRDYPEMPIMTAIQSGVSDPSRRMALEAFVGQVKENSGRRVCAGG